MAYQIPAMTGRALTTSQSNEARLACERYVWITVTSFGRLWWKRATGALVTLAGDGAGQGGHGCGADRGELRAEG
jgi:hypothetical protein